MFSGPNICVSLPAKDITALSLSGSVFEPRELDHATLSPDLRDAIDLIQVATEAGGGTMRCLAHPEIFTHGDSLAWLRATLGDARDHVCISDGSGIRVVPGMDNHVFFYALGRAAHLEAAQRLFKRAPELFSSLTSQINTAIRVRGFTSVGAPPTLHIQPDDTPAGPPPRMLAFYVNPVSPAESADRILARPPLVFADVGDSPLILVPLTQVAIADRAFMDHVAQLVRKAYFETSVRMVLGLPPPDGADQSDSDRLFRVIDAFSRAKAAIPRVPAANVAFSSAPFPHLEPLPAGSTLLAHDSVEVWRTSAAYLRRFDVTQVAKARGQRFEIGAARLLANVLGRPPKIIRCAA